MIHTMLQNTVLMEVAAEGAKQDQGGGNMLVFFVVLIVMMFFMSIYPQRKQMKKTQAMLEALKKGDKVMTNAGIVGTITKMGENLVTLEIAEGVKVQLTKRAISGPVSEEFLADKTAEEK